MLIWYLTLCHSTYGPNTYAALIYSLAWSSAMTEEIVFSRMRSMIYSDHVSIELRLLPCCRGKIGAAVLVLYYISCLKPCNMIDDYMSAFFSRLQLSTWPVKRSLTGEYQSMVGYWWVRHCTYHKLFMRIASKESAFYKQPAESDIFELATFLIMQVLNNNTRGV